MQWGASIGLFVGLVAVFTGRGFAGFLEALISSILITGLIGAVLSGIFGIIGGGYAGSTWGSKISETTDTTYASTSQYSSPTADLGTDKNSVIDEGLTEKILFAFDPRKPLGRSRYIAYMFLYSFVYVVVASLMVLLLNPNDPAVIINAPWFNFGVANILSIPHWLLCARRAIAAKIPVQFVYALMSWLLVFRPICEVTIGNTLAKLVVIPSLILTCGLLFKRNRLQLPYQTR